MGGKLTADEVKRADRDLFDGGGLYLKVSGDARTWVYRFQLNGRRRDMGLGSYPSTSLAKARAARDANKVKVRAGVDPIEERKRQREADRVEPAPAVMTFERCAEQFIEAREAEWRNPKHRQQWRNTLRDYAHPIIGGLPLPDIETSHILGVLEPIWRTKTETAKRVQGRIERVLDYAKLLGLREGENPARWRGHLDLMLPKPSKVTPVQHQRALPWAEAPALYETAAGLDTPASRALLATMLCATRTSETLEATWSELDLDAGLWTIPRERMKAGKPHRIPLPDQAVAVFEAQLATRKNDWVFPGQRGTGPLSYMALTAVLRRSGWIDRTTTHGLRSTFRVWVAEATDYPDRLAEIALAHQLQDRVEAAYNRSDQLEKRRDMMRAWAEYLATP